MKNFQIKNYKHHPYHILSNASVPVVLSASLLIFALGLVFFFHTKCIAPLYLGLFLTILSMIKWSFEILEESKNHYIHNKEIEEQFIFAAFLFIISEIMIFFGFFWAFFHTSLNPSIFMGAVYPPVGIESLNPAHWPLINTLTLLLSGVFVNAFYYTLKRISPSASLFIIRHMKAFSKNQVRNRKLPYTLSSYRHSIVYLLFSQHDYFYGNPSILASVVNSGKILLNYFNKMHTYLILTISLGTIFLFFQVHEYVNHATFELADGIYGSVFYSLTGLHGFHVFAGVFFLIYSLIQLKAGYFDEKLEPHVGITFSVLYFHFVDIVWLFLYIFVYLWAY